MGKMSELSAEVENARAVIGGNNPPEPTLFDQAEQAVELVYGEATLWLDGAAVDNQGMADGLGNLLAEIRKAGALAEQNRKIEKKPFDDGAAEVQRRYNALKDKVALAREACATALTPWLEQRAAQNQAAALAAAAAAAAKQLEAQQALRASDPANLTERAAAEVLVTQAKKATAAATRAGNATATAGGTLGRAIGLRTERVPYVKDPVATARHYWKAAYDEMVAFVWQLAARDVRAGKTDIPGVEIREERKAV